MAAVLVAANSVVSGATTDTGDPESRRVELIARIERSVVVVLVDAREIAHEKKTITREQVASLGTGLILSPDGLVLTAEHVVSNADRVRIELASGETLSARVVFADEAADVALLRLAAVPPGLIPVKLGDSDAVRKGDSAFVIGNPAGIRRSLSAGVISGRHPDRRVVGGTVEADLIQTDAAINSGNSGGPIFNGRGEVIAIAQTILTQGSGSEGLGFGLAINAVKKILGLDPCLWLGFSGLLLDRAWSEALNVPGPGGLLVEHVASSSPAEKAGLRAGDLPIQSGSEHLLLGGDVILRIDGLPVLDWVRRSSDAANAEGGAHEPKLTILRAGNVSEIPIVAIHRTGF